MATEPVVHTRRKSTDTLVIHCSATPTCVDMGVQEIRHWHRIQKLTDVGYHLIIRRNGRVEEGRPIWSVGAHVEGHNATSIGICLVGGSDADGKEQNNFTDEQWSTLTEVINRVIVAWPIEHIKGHREYPGVKKFCPSFDVQAWLKTHRKEFAGDRIIVR